MTMGPSTVAPISLFATLLQWKADPVAGRAAMDFKKRPTSQSSTVLPATIAFGTRSAVIPFPMISRTRLRRTIVPEAALLLATLTTRIPLL